MKKIVIGFFLLVTSQIIIAQTNLSVPSSHPVYKLIESAEVKGLATKLSQVKPYTRRQIIDILAQIDSKNYMLTKQERKVLNYYLKEFSNSFDEEASVADSFMRGRADFAGFKSTASIGLSLDSHWQVAAEDGSEFYSRNPVKIYVRGDLYDTMFSYRVDVQFSFNRLRQYPWIHPGLWQDGSMGFHQSISSSDSGDGTSGGFAIGYDMRPEISGSFWDHRILARFGVVDGRNIGNGTSGLAIGSSATPYQAFDISIRAFPFFNFYSMVGSLGHYYTDAYNGGETSDLTPGDDHATDPRNRVLQNSKFVSYHLGEFFISDFFYLNVWESVIWGKRFEFGYLNPLGIYMFTQNLLGDVDSMSLGVSGATIAPKYFKFWAETYVHEFVFSLSHPRAELANQLGFRFNIPKLPFTTLTAQYTKIEPYVYTHYPQDANFLGTNTNGEAFFTDSSSTNEGKSIGHYLKPNSDEFLIRLESMPLPGLTAYVGWQLIRHGSNPKAKVYMGTNGRVYVYDQNNPPDKGDFMDFTGSGVIDDNWYWGWDPTKVNGELDAPLTYGYADGFRKNFLKDGIYDWTNVFSLGASYDLRSLKLGVDGKKYAPVIVSFDYQVAYTFFDMNGIKIENPEMQIPTYANGYQPYWKNIFVFKFTLYPGY